MTEFVNKSRKVDDRLQEERSEVDKDPGGYYDEYGNNNTYIVLLHQHVGHLPAWLVHAPEQWRN